MRYLPLNENDRAQMLDVIGVKSIDDLFYNVPKSARLDGLIDLPKHQTEQSVEQFFQRLSNKSTSASSVPFFCGAGAYKHHIPATVDHLIQRSEFPVVMAHRVARGKKSKAVLAPGLHPHYAAATQTLASTLNIKIDERETRMGRDDHVVVQSPNVFGEIVDLRPIAEKAHAHKALLIAVFTEPVALAAITPPGEQGADIVVGEGQGLGVGLAFGGPHVGLFACRQKLVRQMPGRVCGETVDANGERGFVLTLSTREQHIRRERGGRFERDLLQ